MIAATLAVLVSGVGIFVAPGAVVLAAAALPLRAGDRMAFAFATSLALLTAAFAACLALGLSIAAAPVALGVATVVVAASLRGSGRGLESPLPRGVSPIPRGDSPIPRGVSPIPRGDSPIPGADSPLVSRLVLALLAATAIAAAVAFAPVGSIDRWWYLAYVRAWLEAPALSLSEPFLGTGQAFARFGVHPWLFGLASWSRLSGVDPVVIYERCAPVLVVLASVSAARALAAELFGEGPRARLCVVATLLLWSGATVPVLARAGEDKVLAASALFPLCVVALLRIVREGDDLAGEARARGNLWLLIGAAIATAAVHALAYAFVLVALLPMAALFALLEPARRRRVTAAVAVLVVVAVAPALSGLVVRSRLHDIGAELAAADHPVVRVHEGRDRLVELAAGGYVVSPRLLVHPLALLALMAVPLVLRRRASALPAHAGAPPERADARSAPIDAPPARQRSNEIGDSARMYLSVATVLPLAIAFVPPLPALAGSLIPPWMVYRVLWLLPLAPLAAVAADAFAARFGAAERGAIVLLLVLGVPVAWTGAGERLADVRERLAAPSGQEFRALVSAVAALPADALLVAAPELAERLPALTARHVVAALDRSTIVFSGSRELGEARLRARAALLAGDPAGSILARAAGVRPTHAVFDPRSTVLPRCGAMLYAGDAYALCELDEQQSSTPRVGTLDVVADAPKQIVARASCDALPPTSHRDPWSPAAPVASCRIAVPADRRGRDDLLLRVETVTGRAVDELVIRAWPAAAQDGSASATVRVSGNAVTVLRLAGTDADAIEVRIASSFLPFVKPVTVALAAQ